MKEQKQSMWNITARGKNSRGYYHSENINVIALDVEKAIETFKRKYPDSTVFSAAHRGEIDLFCSELQV